MQGSRLVIGVAATLPWIVHAQDGPPPRDTDKPVEFASPELAALELFIGPWSVTESHFDPAGKTIATVKGTEEIAWILDHHAIRRVYATTGDKVFKAQGLLTWNGVEKKYHGVWFDNASTYGPSTCKGTWNGETRTMVFELESAGPGGTIRHRVVEKFVDAEKREAATYLVDGSKLIKRLEVEYRRTQPCPDRLRGLFTG